VHLNPNESVSLKCASIRFNIEEKINCLCLSFSNTPYELPDFFTVLAFIGLHLCTTAAVDINKVAQATIMQANYSIGKKVNMI